MPRSFPVVSLSLRTTCAFPHPSNMKITLVSEITFEWKTSGSFLVSVGLDGTLQQGQSSTGVTLSAPMGIHDIRLETVCVGCTNSQTFTLTGVRIVTNL